MDVMSAIISTLATFAHQRVISFQLKQASASAISVKASLRISTQESVSARTSNSMCRPIGKVVFAQCALRFTQDVPSVFNQAHILLEQTSS